MPFADFVKDLYECIQFYANSEGFSLSVFAEGPDAISGGKTGTQEFAVLRNEHAGDFYGLMIRYQKILLPKNTLPVLERSKLFPQEVKISHSCYPKNLRRWMNGTLSRKQKCRADFCALLWCWYDFWLAEIRPDIDKKAVCCSLTNICREYTTDRTEFCIEYLWNACTSAYRMSLERI